MTPRPPDLGRRGRPLLVEREGPSGFSATSRRLGAVSAAATVLLVLTYAATLAIGLLSLDAPEQPVPDPWFAVLEILIIATMPPLVVLMVSVDAWAPAARRSLSRTALVFTGMLALVTSAVHFVVLTLGRDPAFTGVPWTSHVLAFRWPSLAYALDILAWDVFFPLTMLFAAPVFGGSRLALWIRWLMVASAALAFGGLAGVVVDDMRWRNVGIVGYVPVFLVVTVLLGVLFHRTPVVGAERPGRSGPSAGGEGPSASWSGTTDAGGVVDSRRRHRDLEVATPREDP